MEDEKRQKEKEEVIKQQIEIIKSEEVIQAYQMLSAINFSTRFVIAGYKYKAWEVLFKHYNENTGEKLKLGCAPCFGKVKAFIEKKFFPEEYEKNRSAGTANK